MIEEKTYLKVIRSLPFTKCPDRVVSEILQACEHPTKNKKRSSTNWMREMAWGMGCIVIIATFIIMAKWSYDNHSECHTRIAVNSRLLAHQLANGASIIFTKNIK